MKAEETRKSVQEEEVKATEKKVFAATIAADAQRDLDQALPALDAALVSLNSLNKNDVTEVGHLHNNLLMSYTLPVKVWTQASNLMFFSSFLMTIYIVDCHSDHGNYK